MGLLAARQAIPLSVIELADSFYVAYRFFNSMPINPFTQNRIDHVLVVLHMTLVTVGETRE